MDYRLDEIDKRILFHLAADARNVSAPTIAEEVNVSPGTIRNRIKQLEEHGIIQGYTASIDYEQVGRLTDLFVCTSPVPDRATIAQQVLDISGVVNVRELMTGRGNLHVKAVGTDTGDLTRIARALSNLGLEIENEDLVHREHDRPYAPYGPEGDRSRQSIMDVTSLTGGAEVVELTVHEDAPVAGRTLEEANQEGLIGPDVLVIAIERDESVITPKGGTEVLPDDVVSLFTRGGIKQATVQAFGGDE